MKQIRVHGPNDVRLDDVPDPEPGPGDALLRVAACGICGTDVSFIHMGGITGGPQCLGHEMAGVVEWVGADVTDRAVGDRVIVCPSDIGNGPIGSGAALMWEVASSIQPFASARWRAEVSLASHSWTEVYFLALSSTRSLVQWP